MDRNHTLDAPNDEELSGIEQLGDRSDLTSIYREPGTRFEGEVLSAEQREKVKAEELEAITSGLGKHVLSVGLYVVYPFIGFALLAAGAYAAVATMGPQTPSVMILVFSVIFALSIWLYSSYKAYSTIFKIFYKHALRAGPFLIVMLISLIMASQAIYGVITESFAGQSLLFNVAIISLLTVVYSLIASYILLGVWGNSTLKSGIKVLVSGLIVMISAFFVVATYLF